MFTSPTVQQFLAMFFRDFPYGTDPNTGVTDQDILNAFNFTDYSINPAFFPDQNSYNTGYLYLSAHYLVLALRMASQGMSGQYGWAQNSKAVGAVSESFTIPQRVIDNPELMMLTKTQYGAMYLQMVLPQLVGQMFTVCGRSQA